MGICCHSHTTIVLILIERGSKVDSKEFNGQIAFHLACKYDSPKETAILLIRSKVDIYMQSKDGRAPLDVESTPVRVERRANTALREGQQRPARLARRPFLFVLIGCNHIESESNKHNASKQALSGDSGVSRGTLVTRGATRTKVGELRDKVLQDVCRNIDSSDF